MPVPDKIRLDDGAEHAPDKRVWDALEVEVENDREWAAGRIGEGGLDARSLDALSQMVAGLTSALTERKYRHLYRKAHATAGGIIVDRVARSKWDRLSNGRRTRWERTSRGNGSSQR